MADLGEIVEELRTTEGIDSGQESDKRLAQGNNTKRKRSKRRRDSGGSQVSPQTFLSGDVPGGRREDNKGGRRSARQPVDGEDLLLVQEDHEARFYREYSQAAEEYDREFHEKYDEDSNTSLIFAGLFSVVVSTFIVQIDSQLRPNPGDETAALLRILIYKTDNTTFGNEVPSLPQWTGPSPTVVNVQTILYASLAASLLSAFLAMLGKQWLNRYASIDMRGSATERCQNRQRKLDGIIVWYFDSVMESLPVLSQLSLLLLACALSRYLWDVSITVTSVLLGVALFGAIFYLFIIIAGAISDACPYQTPASFTLRRLWPKAWNAFHSIRWVLGGIIRQSRVADTVLLNADMHYPWWSGGEIIPFLRDLILQVPLGFIIDLYHLGRAVIQALSTLPVRSYLLVLSANSRLRAIPTPPHQRTRPHWRCISWLLHAYSNKLAHLTTFKYLQTMTELTGLDPTLVADCFYSFAGSFGFSNNKPVLMDGLDQLATVSAACFFRTFYHLSATDPTSYVLVALHRSFNAVFPSLLDIADSPFISAMAMIHVLVGPVQNNHRIQWHNYRAPSQEHIPFARYIAEAARVEYQQTPRRKVPRWILRFALQSLSLDPPSPTPVVSDCLTIIAIDLDCDVSSTEALDPSARVEKVSNLITQMLKTMAEASVTDPSLLQSKHKAIDTLFPYAIRLEQGGEQDMFDAILCVAKASEFIFKWRHIETHVAAVFDEHSSSSLDRVIALASPLVSRHNGFETRGATARWATAASTIPYSEEVGPSVVDLLLRVSDNDSLRRTPIYIWEWLKNRPSLPPVCLGRSKGSQRTIVRHVRGLGDIEILKSYLFLIWSEWDTLDFRGFVEMQTSIREDFGGDEMRFHRKDLIQHLDHVLGELDQGLEYFKQRRPEAVEGDIRLRKTQYEQLKAVLLEAEKRGTETLTESHLTFSCALPL